MINSKRILIVDDDPGICRMLTRYLNEQGFNSECVGDALQMDEWLNNHQPDLILLDLCFPVKTAYLLPEGLEAYQKFQL